MMPQAGPATRDATRRRLARKYKVLGYDVRENPGPDRLPDFMRGTSPDIVALGTSDNVVIEIRGHAALKGSNDLVALAERVSGRADWRFELVVLEDAPDATPFPDAHDGELRERVRVATDHRLSGMAFVYLADLLVRTARELARRRTLPASDRGERALFLDLGFRGILPDVLVERCLSALAARDGQFHARTPAPSEKEVQTLLGLCDEVRSLL